MAKKSDVPAVRVDVPEHLLQLVAGDTVPDTLETMRHHRILNRIAVVQSNSPREKKDKYGEASIVLPAIDTVLCTQQEQIDVVPVMFFDEYVRWADRKDKSGPMIQERSMSRTSKLAQACDDPNRWRVKYGEKGEFIARNCHHLNFLVVIYKCANEALKGTLAVLSLSRSEYKKGLSWMANIQQRKIAGRQAPLWSTVWTVKIGPRKNEHGEWYGIDISNAENPYIGSDDIEGMKLLHEQLLKDYKDQALEVGHEEAETTEGDTEAPTGTEY
jgi:hypothetical protein